MLLSDLVRHGEREKAGLAGPATAGRKRAVADLLDAFHRHQFDKGNGREHADTSRRRLQILTAGAGFLTAADLDAGPAERWLADERQTNPRFGFQTSNHYVTVSKTFGNWLVRTRVLAENPFRFLTKLNVELDVRHDRRELTAAECEAVLAAARVGKRFRRLSAPDRAVLYTVAGYTGLRASELASLTPASFDLTADPPTVTVEAGYSKRKRRDTLPLHPGLTAALAPWLAGRDPAQRLWPGRWAADHSAVDLIRRDLDRARTAYLAASTGPADRARREADGFLVAKGDDGRVLDFHSLRHTFIIDVVRSGATVKEAQELARHFDPALTLSRYTHLSISDTAGAVARLPGLTTPPNNQPEAVELKATGTDPAGSLSPRLSPTSGGKRGSEKGMDDPAPTYPFPSLAPNPWEKKAVEGLEGQEREVPAVRIERTTPGLGNQCSIP